VLAAHGALHRNLRPLRYRTSDAASLEFLHDARRQTAAATRPGMDEVPLDSLIQRGTNRHAIRVVPCPVQVACRAAPLSLAPVGRTPGISCERPICSTLVCFIPLLGGAGALTGWGARRVW
jgi:hypothetical protein